jgi:hypothetical protein
VYETLIVPKKLSPDPKKVGQNDKGICQRQKSIVLNSVKMMELLAMKYITPAYIGILLEKS